MAEPSRLTRSHFVLGTLAASGLAMLPRSRALAASPYTALDRYISAPDPNYTYRLIKTIPDPRYQGYVLELTSQQWRSAREVDRPLWKHWLTIVEPRTVKSDMAALIISGGSNTDDAPTDVEESLVRLSLATDSVAAEIKSVPNQPLTFSGEMQPRSEDDLIAYSWQQYLRTGDDTWPLRLPMTKSVVRAMDAVSDFCRGNGTAVHRFVIGGTSKRGWTTWTTAAADRRVVGIVPIVIDVLNMRLGVEHTYRTYGSWPSAWHPYEALGIFDWLGTPQLNDLLTIEDPFTYRERLTMPKLIVNATGDQFFVPDSSRFYYNALAGEKYLRYVPNTDHSLKNVKPDHARTILAFYRSLVHGTAPPNITWHDRDDGSIEVLAEKPSSVKLWRAINPAARDFRLDTIGSNAFQSIDLENSGDNRYVTPRPTPQRGWEASFVEVTYKPVAGQPFTITSDVRITPDTLPFGPPRLQSRR